MKIHIVQKGDTLWKIAQKYGVQFEELKQINSQLSNPDMIMPGMKIKVPSSGTAKNTQMQSNTKINFGSKKEAPIPGVTASPIKEMPMKEMVSPTPAQPEPMMFEQQPKVIKEQPMPMPQPAPVIPQMPQPIIPDVDINNYYMVNMSNMMVQKPQQMQPQAPPVQKQEQPVSPMPVPEPAPAPAAKPIVAEEEKEEAPVQIQPYPVMAEGCVPITPVMPGAGFCPPVYPMHHLMNQPMYGPGPVQMQPMMPQHHHYHESSSWHEPQMASWQYGEYMPVMHQQQWAPFYGGMPYNPGVNMQAPNMSPHGMHHHVESSSSHHHAAQMIQPTYYQTAHAGTEMTNMPIMEEEEEDCGCGGPKFPSEAGGEMNAAPQPAQYYQPQMQQWDQYQKAESHSQMNDSQMNDSQMNAGQYGSAYQPQMSNNQAPMGGSSNNMYQPPMGENQANMYPPQMGMNTASMYPPQMGMNTAGMYPPQMGMNTAGMYSPQMGMNTAGMYPPQMEMNTAGTNSSPMTGGSADMQQPQMGGNTANMYSLPTGSQQAVPQAQSNMPYQMPMQPWPQGMPQSQMNPNQPNVFVPHMNYPAGNPAPFYGQDDYASDIGQMKNYSDAFDLPRYADESNE
ncbi:SafA/ExsA family spore coat assembly protein [Bacillus sp. AGMB 02131]|uniref:SafA/ExsA family spore coat assembly protein n=1 Tax=Peribacillus faecalis TaxID=2772559 RepID=A0A927CVD0_9BACI|nr:SafA/ExsA family spore coat assembly protein [Peribacillus faecalis]MBD3107854.1 SafA/ExsA family spore coat assembly protein [Peribacillus faecalis]